MRNVQFGVDEYYHIFNRGVDRRRIFLDTVDFLRFYQSLYLFNDNDYRHDGERLYNESLLASQERLPDMRKPLVDIAALCLMGNHYHLLIRQTREDGITRFMHRLSMGYAKYFNRRYKRSGALFEGEYRAIHVQRDAHFLHLPRYIVLNALDGSEYTWRLGSVDDWDGAERFLDAYPWSSHHVHIGRRQELPVVDERSSAELFVSPDDYRACLRAWTGREIPMPVQSLSD